MRSTFVCQNCGAQSLKWQGRCLECGQWNTLVEEALPKALSSSKSGARPKNSVGGRAAKDFAKTQILSEELEKTPLLKEKISAGYSEVDRVLGGGFVPGSLLLVGGEPGIGKSTLLLQIIGKVSEKNLSALYMSGEESGTQVAQRAQRLQVALTKDLHFLATTSLDEGLAAIEKLSPRFVVVDSIQTMSSSDIESAPGTVSQIRAVTHTFMELSKTTGTIVILVGHVTKEGTVAGPRLLEHMVDGVFYFELASSSGYRMLRGQKNRFGATHEVAVFEMTSKGLDQVENPSARFLAERVPDMFGSAVVAHLEGSRPFLTEFQALCQRCYQGYPRRTVQGVDQNRISVLLAIIEKTLDISFSDKDIYCKVASGDRIEEPAADLALLMALVSAAEERAIPSDLLLVGEVGLGGEIRSVPGIGARLSEAKSVGIRRAILPSWHQKEAQDVKGIEILPVTSVKEAYTKVWPRK